MSDEIIIQLVRDRMGEEDCSTGFILDGFPRTVEQARLFDEMLSTAEESVGMMIVLDVAESMLVSSLLTRTLHW